MKRVIALWAILTMVASCIEDTLVSRIEEGEEPGLTHYYLYFASTGSGRDIIRVRWIIDSESHNHAKITDYIFESNGIRIKEMSADGPVRAELVAGKDLKVKTISEYLLATTDSGERLVPPAPDKALTNLQRCDLHTLINLLARERPPIKPTDEQPGAGQPAINPADKPPVKDKPSTNKRPNKPVDATASSPVVKPASVAPTHHL